MNISNPISIIGNGNVLNVYINLGDKSPEFFNLKTNKTEIKQQKDFSELENNNFLNNYFNVHRGKRALSFEKFKEIYKPFSEQEYATTELEHYFYLNLMSKKAHLINVKIDLKSGKEKVKQIWTEKEKEQIKKLYGIIIEDIENMDKKIKILSNPPYGLIGKKILIKILKSGSKVSFIFPESIVSRLNFKEKEITEIRNLLKNKFKLLKHILPENANDLFIDTGLKEGLVVIDKDEQYKTDDFKLFRNEIYEIIEKKAIKNNLKRLNSFKGKGKYKLYVKGYHTNQFRTSSFIASSEGNSDTFGKEHLSICFETIQERNNFIEWACLPLTNYINFLYSDNCHTSRMPLPPTFDIIWTDKMLCDYFQISDKDYSQAVSKKICRYKNIKYNSLELSEIQKKHKYI